MQNFAFLFVLFFAGSAGVTIACSSPNGTKDESHMSAHETQAEKWPSRRSPQLFVRQGNRIEEAPEADHAVARKYPAYENKGPVTNGIRVTVLSEKLLYQLNEPVRVIHVFEATEPGIDVHIMGPKTAHGEFVDGVLRTTKPPTAQYPWVGVYDGAVLPSPDVDYNYEINSYTFSEAGRHTIQWKPGQLESNVLVINIEGS